MGRLSNLSLPEPQDITSLLEDNAPTKELIAGTSGVAVAAGATPLAVAVPVLAQALSEEKGIELLARADQQLDESIEQLNEERRSHRCLGAVLRGVSTVLPAGEQYSDLSLLTAESDPTKLAELFQAYQNNSEYRERVEMAIERVLAGELGEETLDEKHDDFVDYLRDEFGVETREEALALFLDFRELLQAREVHESIERVHDIDLDSEGIEATLNETREQLIERLDAILEAEVRSEGFHRLSPHFFDGHEKRADPVLGWRAGFRLVDVRSGYALEREKEIDGERRRITPHLTNRLQDGEDVVVVGLPGSGKSTILKAVACHWYEHQHGTVFYRTRPSSKPFEKVGQLERAIDNAEGHVLVVVEDATRDAADLGDSEDSANPVFALQEQYAKDSTVSFLLDSRMKEWKEKDHTITDARRGVSKSQLQKFYVPQFDSEDPVEVKRAVEQFKTNTDCEVNTSPEQLAEEIQTPLGAGEMYLLGYRLSAYAAGIGDGEDTEWTGLRVNGVRPVYNDLAPDDEYDTDTLPLQVGLLFSVLTAAEVDIYREYLATLASDEDEYQQIDRILRAQQWRLHYGRNRETNAYRTNHPLWAMLFLEEGLERAGWHEDVVIGAFEDAVNALFRFFEYTECRKEVAEWMDDEFASLERPDSEAVDLAHRVVLSIFNVGIERPALAPLFRTTDESDIEFPAVCPPTTEYWCRTRRGIMFMHRGGTASNTGVAGVEDGFGEFVRPEQFNTAGGQSDFERAEMEFERLKTFAEAESTLGENRLIGIDLNLGGVAQQRGQLDTAERRLSQARERFDQIGDDHSATTCLMNLGGVAQQRGQLDAAERHLSQARERFDQSGGDHSAIKCLANLGLVAKGRGELDAAERHLSQARERFDQIGDDYSATTCLLNLGLVAKGRGELDAAERRLSQARERFDQIGDADGVAKCTANLGQVYFHREDYDAAESELKQALGRFEHIGDYHNIALATDYLGAVARHREEPKLACDRFEDALVGFLELGILRDVRPCLRSLVECYEELEDKQRAEEGIERILAAADRTGADELARTIRDGLAD